MRMSIGYLELEPLVYYFSGSANGQDEANPVL